MNDPLPPSKLRNACDPDIFPFKTTAEVPPDLHIIGQPRGTQAIDFGLHITSPGYNIYVLGESGTGRRTAIKRFIEEKARTDPIPNDWVYVFNFSEPHRPLAISLPPGMGASLKRSMDTLVSFLLVEIPRAFDNETFRDAALKIQQQQVEKRDQLLADIHEKAAGLGAGIMNSAEGLQIIPVRDGQPVSPADFARLPEEERKAWKETAYTLEHDLGEAMHDIRALEKDGLAEIEKLIRRVAGTVANLALEETLAEFQEYAQVGAYLESVRHDILENTDIFREEETGENAGRVSREFLRRRYTVNVIVGRNPRDHNPVVLEDNPTMSRLLGRIEHESRMGGVTMTDFTLLRGGAIHDANGGYLVLRAKDLFSSDPGPWEALKRVLIGGTVTPDDPSARVGMATRSLDPQPIPVDLKVIMIGPPDIYYSLHARDEDFQSIFKVLADFDLEMPRSAGNEQEYATFVAMLCHDEGLLAFDRYATARLVDYGSRIAESQTKLTTRFGLLADVIREANFWAAQHARDIVTAADVLEGIEKRVFRTNRFAEHMRANMQNGKQLIAATGETIGQINGLYVMSIGEHTFGQPSRLTARTYAGQQGVVQIDREVDMSGAIHDKGVYILTGFLGSKYAQEVPLSLSAQITFEQSYNGVDGDSASSTELYALISSLAGVPIKQTIAVTGSVNQLGEIQAIGGVTQKVEGWFELCQERGLTGEQGVLIPESNADDLMLSDPVIAAAEVGKFHVWTARTVDDGLEILTGLPAADIHAKAQGRLKELAEISKQYE